VCTRDYAKIWYQFQNKLINKKLVMPRGELSNITWYIGNKRMNQSVTTCIIFWKKFTEACLKRVEIILVVCTNNNKISRLDKLVFYHLLIVIIIIILLRAKMGSICIHLLIRKKRVTKRNYFIFLLEVRVHVLAWIVQVSSLVLKSWSP
jgi:hypothetical protein